MFVEIDGVMNSVSKVSVGTKVERVFSVDDRYK